MSETGVGYRADIDGLRALAVAIVILFHLDVGWLPGGFVGVDVFFVISGFLITSLITRRIDAGSFSLIDFYERRFRRIYPNLVIVLAATVVLGWLSLIMQTYQTFGRTLVWAALSASNFVFMGGGGYFDPGSINKPLLHTWSLGVEEQFYLVFPWLLMLAARRGYRPSWLIAGTVVLSLALSIAGGIANWAPSYFLLPTRFWELGIGGLIAILPLQDRLRSTGRAVLGVAGLAGVVWASLFLNESASFPGYLALPPVLGAAALVVANGGPVNRLMALAPFASVGRLSYALYLWHWPLIVIAASVGLPPQDPTTRVLVVGLSLVLSFVGYHLWEMPIRRRQFLSSRRALFAALTTCVLLLVGMGISIYTAKGFPHRLPKEISDIYLTTKNGSRLIFRQCLSHTKVPYTCPVGSQEAQGVSFFIIGDSHSEATAAEIGEVAAQYGLRGLFFGQNGCRLFADPVTGETTQCIAEHELAMQSFGKYHPALIIAITRWPDYLADNPADPEFPTRYSSMYDTFDKSLSFYAASTVVTAPSVPTYGVNIAEFAGRAWFRERIGLDAPPVPTMPLAEYRRRQASVQGLLETEQLNHPNLRITDPATVLCPNDTCTSMAGNMPLYYDTNHLSHTGAQLYASLFRPYFAEVAGRPAGLASSPPSSR
ncbi:acyltransferase family protein [Pleomorphomonas oryzae]|uniref:acyltransferase family protein n=1 Tax=Pleomorphomonas oryzae TaxID=261934 RepID=UPI0012EBCEFE|nr:acyltransferase family protein [Pleomorphomonas oryzae]